MHTRLPQELASSSPLPDVIQGYVSVRSQGGQSVLDASLDQIASGTTPYRAAHADIDAACKALDGIGFTILATSRVGVAVAGKPGAFEELTGGQLVTFERLMHAEAGRLRYVTHIDVVGSEQPEARCVAGIKAGAQTEFEGVLVERPRMLQGVFPAPIPPIVPRFYLRVPDDVALLLNAIPAHPAGPRRRRGEGRDGRQRSGDASLLRRPWL